MRWTLMAASAGFASALAITSGFTSAAVAGPTAAFELEHARANSTGGPDWRKQYRAQKHYGDVPARTYRSKKKTRVYHD